MNHFFSLQYAAIQKTVLRHDRLWSMAGISAALSELNEITLKAIVEAAGGQALVAGGGKFTARFNAPEAATDARDAAIREVSTRFPMLEFQVSDLVRAEELFPMNGQAVAALQPLMDDLKDQKRRFRGYGLTFNPHLLLCGECGEYPAAHPQKSDDPVLCRTCDRAKNEARISLSDLSRADTATLTTIQRVYSRYLAGAASAVGMKVPHNFEDLFPKPKNRETAGDEPAERRRMAVWLSDINSMKNKVNIWLREPDILVTFQQVKDVFIEAVADALARTFPAPTGNHLPFRLIIAGGDDLCLVMAEESVLDFAVNLSAASAKKLAGLPVDHPLNPDWLAEKQRELELDTALGPYCFGGAFIIGSIHTPFRRIHEVGEELMTAAKQETGRTADSINWRIMAEEVAQTDRLLPFEKPVFIDGRGEKRPWDRLDLRDYLTLRDVYGGISGSHRFQIISKMIEFREAPHRFERWLKAHAASDNDKDFSGILTEPRLRKNGRLAMDRIATLFELMSIKGGATNGTQH